MSPQRTKPTRRTSRTKPHRPPVHPRRTKPSRPRRSRRRWVWWTVAAVVVVLVLLGGIYLLRGRFVGFFGNGPAASFDPNPKTLDGALYYGSLHQGKPHGTGFMQLEDGSIWSGTWRDGERDGVMRYSDKQGRSSFSVWSEGTKTRDLPLPTSTFEGAPCRYGIDVSRYQPEYWGAMLISANDAGIPSSRRMGDHWLPVEFVIIKASGQKGVADPLYQYHSSMAEMLCILQGAYHVFSSRVDIEQQVRAYLDETSDVTLAFPPILDIEGSTSEISKSHFLEIEPLCLLWLERVEAETGIRPMIYCCLDFYNAYGTDSRLADYTFWIANYGKAAFPESCSLRQISETGRIAGWRSYVDIDVLILPENNSVEGQNQ